MQTERIDSISELRSTARTARIAGVWYLLLAVTAPFGFFYLPTLIVSGDATATANNILASETLVRLGIVVELASAVTSVFLVMALYRLLARVDRNYARLMVVLGALVSAPISFMNALNEIAALELIHGASFLSSFSQSQLNALAMVFLNLHSQGFILLDIFFGLWLFPFGLLVYRSGFIPRILGMLLFVNGSVYLANSLVSLTSPSFLGLLSPVLTVLYLVGEPPMVAWLLIKGATRKWMMPPAGR